MHKKTDRAMSPTPTWPSSHNIDLSCSLINTPMANSVSQNPESVEIENLKGWIITLVIEDFQDTCQRPLGVVFVSRVIEGRGHKMGNKPHGTPQAE